MLAVVILAGGRASRFPGKLEREFRGEPLVLRVLRNVRDAGPVFVAANCTFPAAIDAALDCPLVIDRWPGAGPLAALHTALGEIPYERVFAVSADMPFVNAGAARELLGHWRDGLDAVAAVDGSGHVQPLCAVYDRRALLEAAGAALAQRQSSVKSAMERLRIERVALQDDRVLAGINTPEDLVAVGTFDLGLRARA